MSDSDEIEESSDSDFAPSTTSPARSFDSVASRLRLTRRPRRTRAVVVVDDSTDDSDDSSDFAESASTQLFGNTGGDARPAAPKTWACPRCTFLNKFLALQCICGSKRPQSPAASTVKASELPLAPIFQRSATRPARKSTGASAQRAKSTVKTTARTPVRTAARTTVRTTARTTARSSAKPASSAAVVSTPAARTSRPAVRAISSDLVLKNRQVAHALKSGVGAKRRKPTLREAALQMHASKVAADRKEAAAASSSPTQPITPLPLPKLPESDGPTTAMKYRLPFFKSIAELKADGVELFGKQPHAYCVVCFAQPQSVLINNILLRAHTDDDAFQISTTSSLLDPHGSSFALLRLVLVVADACTRWCWARDHLTCRFMVRVATAAKLQHAAALAFARSLARSAILRCASVILSFARTTKRMR